MTTDTAAPPITETGVPKSLAHLAYDAYAVSTGGKTWDDRDMPGWHELPENIQAAWTAAAERIVANIALNAQPHIEEIVRQSHRMTAASLVRHQDVVEGGAVLIDRTCEELSQLLTPGGPLTA